MLDRKEGVMKKRPKKMMGGGMAKKGVVKKRPTGMKAGKSVRKAVKKEVAVNVNLCI